tara:strand:+ start:890 stop:1552 length:663 start_codon:yes stop_codon:yes gene_type:complete
MILEDFVMLGKTAPETDRQGRVTVCSAGWSPELRQLIRIYPLAVEDAPADFSVSRIKLERNYKDSRHESWKIGGERGVDVHSGINARFDVQRILNDRSSLIGQIPVVGSIAEANAKRLSLAVVQPEVKPDFYLQKNGARKLVKKEVSTNNFKYIPRLKFELAGKVHKLKYLNREVYENIAPNNKTDFWKISGRFKNNPKLLVGNMFAYRKNWLVISGLGG